MSHAFSSQAGLILVTVEFSGPSGKARAELVMDTGATTTIVDADLLRSVGYDPDASTDHAVITTGNGDVTVPRLMLNRLTALGRHAIGLQVLAHSLSAEADIDGLLGLDFFRGLSLTIDFRAGQITLI